MKTMRIGIDIMGGDYAPEAILKGAILAQKVVEPTSTIVLIGDEGKAREFLKNAGVDENCFEFAHASEVIEMGDHPTKSFSQKSDSSISVGFRLLAEGKIDGFASAGNTGAMMVGSMFSVKAIEGVSRPTISAILPRPAGNDAILLDVGLNSDCKPEVLYQYGILGKIYAQHVMNHSNPKVGLLNVGSEEEKGNLLAKATFELMKDSKDFDFLGNCEGHDLFKDDGPDVIVCDGFVGNVVLKEAEAFYKLFRQRGLKDEYFERFNFANYGGTPVLGVNAPVIIGHGISNDTAIKNMILLTENVIRVNLVDKIKEAFK